jgi:tetratricopeptide (TPR) repeat protein
MDLTTAILKDKTLVVAYSNLGLLLAMQKDYNRAVEQYLAALAINPNQIATRYNLAAALLQLNQVDKAREQFEMLARNAPSTSFEAEQAKLWLQANP